ncbi:hypothetical protein BJ973_003520 [Actinoplanes tereljensis]
MGRGGQPQLFGGVARLGPGCCPAREAGRPQRRWRHHGVTGCRRPATRGPPQPLP